MLAGYSTYCKWDNVPASEADYDITVYTFESDINKWVHRTFDVDAPDFGRYVVYIGDTRCECSTRTEVEELVMQHVVQELTSNYVSWRDFCAKWPQLVSEFMYGLERIDDNDATQIIGKYNALWNSFVESERVGERELRREITDALNDLVTAVESAGGEW